MSDSRIQTIDTTILSMLISRRYISINDLLDIYLNSHSKDSEKESLFSLRCGILIEEPEIQFLIAENKDKELYYLLYYEIEKPSKIIVIPSQTSLEISYDLNNSLLVSHNLIENIKYEYRIAESSGDYGKWISINSNPFTIENLTASTNYKIQMRSFRFPDIYSEPTVEVTVTTTS